MFSYADLEELASGYHPSQLIREIVNSVLTGLSSDFEAAYLHTACLSIPPKKLLQAFCPVRSECKILEQLDFTILFCWLDGLDVDIRVCSAGTYCDNRDDVAIACVVILMVKNLDFCIVAPRHPKRPPPTSPPRHADGGSAMAGPATDQPAAGHTIRRRAEDGRG